jgi:hypothetical protein
MSVLLGRRGKHREALKLCKRALAIIESARGPKHPHVAAQLSSVALIEWERACPASHVPHW